MAALRHGKYDRRTESAGVGVAIRRAPPFRSGPHRGWNAIDQTPRSGFAVVVATGPSRGDLRLYP